MLSNVWRLTCSLMLLAGLQACSGSGDSGSDGNSSTGIFNLSTVEAVNLVEGEPTGANIPITLVRSSGHNKTVTLSVTGVNSTDDRLITASYYPQQLGAGVNSSSVNLFLSIDDLPIMPQERKFYIDANDGTDSARTTVIVNVQPVNAPDVYLLAGQSNMVGFSGDGTKLANSGDPDEPHPRIYQLNVTKNDSVFSTRSDFIDEGKNVIVANQIVRAEDPLHIPVDPSNTSNKNHSYIGMGLSFAKAALNDTTQNIVLVPTAWSASRFCDDGGGPPGQWNAQSTSNPNLGNTWLFDRAVVRTNIALRESGGILRGILWHQGESDSNSLCAGEYLANLERLAQELRLQINADRRGGDLRRPEANIPFVLGTMSRGIDERGDLSNFWSDKQLVDNAHRTIPSKVRHSEVTYNDDLVPDNGYPCGNTTCIHFGAAALREMGRRYYTALLRAAANP